jgi:hypothetical protein
MTDISNMLDRETLANFYNYVKAFHNLPASQDDMFNSIASEVIESGGLFGHKLFLIEDNTLEYLTEEYTKNKIGLRKMPFNKLLLLNSVNINNRKICGMFFNKIISSEGTESINAYCFIKTPNSENGNYCQSRLYVINIEDDTIRARNLFTDDEELKWTAEDSILTHSIRIFMCNFLDFLINPEVEFIRVERTIEQNEKRMKRGKIPLPNYDFVKVNGMLKIDLEKLRSGEVFHYSHRFWVRGHFRTLRSERRYKDKVGVKIWIVPYIKGKGLLIEKPYLIKKSEVNNG